MSTQKVFLAVECNCCINCYFKPIFRFLRYFGLSGVVPKSSCGGGTSSRGTWRDAFLVFSLWGWFAYMLTVLIVAYFFSVGDDFIMILILKQIFQKEYLTILLMLTIIVFFASILTSLFNYSSSRDAITIKFCQLWKEANQSMYYSNIGEKIETSQKWLLYFWLPSFFCMETAILFNTAMESYEKLWLKFDLIRKIKLIMTSIITLLIFIVYVNTFVYFYLTCKLLKLKFNEVVDELRTISDKPEGNVSIKKVHAKHHKICKIVEAVDNFHCKYIFIMYLISLPSLCIVLHQLYLAIQNEHKSARTLAGLCVTLVLTILFVTLSSGSVSSAALRPKEVLHNFSILSLSSTARLELNIFLERLNGPTIGFTCLDFFVVTKGTLSSIASVLVTYLLMYLQFNQSRKSQN